VTACLRDLGDGDLYLGPADDALVDRGPHPGIRAPAIPHGRDAEPERLGQHGRGVEELHRERLRQDAGVIEVHHRHVHVAVEQPWQQRTATDVHQFVAIQARADLDYPAPLDHDVRAGKGKRVRVEHRAAGQQSPGREGDRFD
jgi:hypothetical protein